MVEYPKSKSIGGFYRPDRSPCRKVSFWLKNVVLKMETFHAGHHAAGAGQLGRDDGGRRRGLTQGQSGWTNITFIVMQVMVYIQSDHLVW